MEEFNDSDKMAINLDKTFESASDLELEYYDFYSKHGTRLGWLKMLSTEELKSLKKELDGFGSENLSGEKLRESKFVRLPLFTIIANKKSEITDGQKVYSTVKEISEEMNSLEIDCSFILMERSGLIKIVEMGDNDGDWQFSLTEKGKKFAEMVDKKEGVSLEEYISNNLK